MSLYDFREKLFCQLDVLQKRSSYSLDIVKIHRHEARYTRRSSTPSPLESNSAVIKELVPVLLACGPFGGPLGGPLGGQGCTGRCGPRGLRLDGRPVRAGKRDSCRYGTSLWPQRLSGVTLIGWPDPLITLRHSGQKKRRGGSAAATRHGGHRKALHGLSARSVITACAIRNGQTPKLEDYRGKQHDVVRNHTEP
ncbi:Hypothetical predicted protein [Olea europaea subsp. europaea]|uniref:Uncharacterized protein n=1 Tax=Olea europaea subsp. europaea TaxID=158383 RepID=A0A8S0RCI0_OLEEU|nr:Hypothetical predicted protein [Olea europaea subsp. europaea]